MAVSGKTDIMGKELSLFGNDFEAGDYRYSVWMTNSKDTAYEVWKQCRLKANDENTIKELKEDFALGCFSMKHFYSTEAAMLIPKNAVQMDIPVESNLSRLFANSPYQT